MVDEKLRKYREDIGHFIAYRFNSKAKCNESLIKVVLHIIKTYGVCNDDDSGLFCSISNKDRVNSSYENNYWLSSGEVRYLLYNENFTRLTEEQKLNRQKIMEA